MAPRASRQGTDTAAAAGGDSPRPGADLDTSGYVRRARRLADLSQRELSKRTGIDQTRISRIEGGGHVDLRSFVGILAAADLRLVVVDGTGAPVTPMPPDVFRDRAGRRRPAHLDVHAVPEIPTMKMLLHAVDPVPPGGAWHHLRQERDRLRRRTGSDATTEQLTTSVARARRRRPAGSG